MPASFAYTTLLATLIFSISILVAGPILTNAAPLKLAEVIARSEDTGSGLTALKRGTSEVRSPFVIPHFGDSVGANSNVTKVGSPLAESGINNVTNGTLPVADSGTNNTVEEGSLRPLLELKTE